MMNNVLAACIRSPTSRNSATLAWAQRSDSSREIEVLASACMVPAVSHG
jgi:hypothetical protein